MFQNFSFFQRYTFGRFIEILPYSISGFFIAYFEILTNLNKKRIKAFYLCFVVFFLNYKYDLIIRPIGFDYQGIKNNILSICLFICFSFISNNIFSKSFAKMIEQISLLTPGVYYLHIPLLHYFEIIFLSVKEKTIYGSIFIYIISYLLSFIGNKVVKKTKLRNLFQ